MTGLDDSVESGVPPRNGLPWRVWQLERFQKRVEELKPEVMAFELGELRKDVTALKRAFYTFAISVVGSSVVFAFTVFALLGRHS